MGLKIRPSSAETGNRFVRPEIDSSVQTDILFLSESFGSCALFGLGCVFFCFDVSFTFQCSFLALLSKNNKGVKFDIIIWK